MQNAVKSSVHVVGCTQVGNPFKNSQVAPNEQVKGQLVFDGGVGGTRVVNGFPVGDIVKGVLLVGRGVAEVDTAAGRSKSN